MKLENILNGNEVLLLANEEYAVAWDLNDTLKMYSIATWEATKVTHIITHPCPSLHHAIKEAKWLFNLTDFLARTSENFPSSPKVLGQD